MNAREIAEANTIYRCISGSRSYGTDTEAQNEVKKAIEKLGYSWDHSKSGIPNAPTIISW